MDTVIQKSDQEISKAARDAVMPFAKRKRMIVTGDLIHCLMMSKYCPTKARIRPVKNEK